MMDHLIFTDLSRDINALLQIAPSKQLVVDVLNACKRCNLISANISYHIELPAWLKRAYLICWQVENNTNCTDVMFQSLETEVQNATYVEMSHIIVGLRNHRLARKCASVSDKHTFHRKSENYLKLATNLWKSKKTALIDNCSETIVRSFQRGFMEHEANKESTMNTSRLDLVTNLASTSKCKLYTRNLSIDEEVVNKSLIYSRSINWCKGNYTRNKRNDARICISGLVDIAVYFIVKENTCNRTHVQLYKEWPGVSPTVNISWFVAKAYLANFYYTTQHDVSQTIATCDDIIVTFKMSRENRLFAELTIPVVLSTEYAAIYDKKIQEMLGFYSLCAHIIDASLGCSVYLGVCPVQFSLYVKVCATGAGTLSKGAQQYIDHLSRCQCDANVNNGVLCMSSALQNWKIDMQAIQRRDAAIYGSEDFKQANKNVVSHTDCDNQLDSQMSKTEDKKKTCGSKTFKPDSKSNSKSKFKSDSDSDSGPDTDNNSAPVRAIIDIHAPLRANVIITTAEVNIIITLVDVVDIHVIVSETMVEVNDNPLKGIVAPVNESPDKVPDSTTDVIDTVVELTHVHIEEGIDKSVNLTDTHVEMTDSPPKGIDTFVNVTDTSLSCTDTPTEVNDTPPEVNDATLDWFHITMEDSFGSAGLILSDALVNIIKILADRLRRDIVSNKFREIHKPEKPFNSPMKLIHTYRELINSSAITMSSLIQNSEKMMCEDLTNLKYLILNTQDLEQIINIVSTLNHFTDSYTYSLLNSCTIEKNTTQIKFLILLNTENFTPLIFLIFLNISNFKNQLQETNFANII